MILTSLFETQRAFEIDTIEFLNLLSAFKQDSVKQRYNSFSELIDYSSRSANPIGHLILNVFGYKKEDNTDLFKYSDSVCTALQLTNFWQDVSVDLEIGRIYIPEEEMRKYDYNTELLFNKNENDNFRQMMKYLVERTREFFDEGIYIVKLLKGRLRYEIKATCSGGLNILGKIEDINYSVLSERVSFSGFEKVKLIIKSIL